MNPIEPYLIRAFYEWIIGNDHTPLILVNAEADDVMVPQANVIEGKITLNINPFATESLELGADAIHFRTRFNGMDTEIYVPNQAVVAIYSRDTGQGMVFNPEGGLPPNVPTPDSPLPTKQKKEKPKLKIY